ncbi:Uncharacterised protein [Klebsiella pneumoniae]|nr:Uncharacterised protein [Klebsiella pneumoniae]
MAQISLNYPGRYTFTANHHKLFSLATKFRFTRIVIKTYC